MIDADAASSAAAAAKAEEHFLALLKCKQASIQIRYLNTFL